MIAKHAGKQHEMDEWDQEWDRMTHTSTDYKREIRDMRERIQCYVQRIEELEEEVRQLKRFDSRWVQEP
jgi:predicted  nucleic acid-binding Zn-ribbon protein